MQFGRDRTDLLNTLVKNVPAHTAARTGTARTARPRMTRQARRPAFWKRDEAARTTAG